MIVAFSRTFSGGGGSFSPSDVSSLRLWLKADSIAGSDGDAIATWADSSGGGFDGTQSTAGYKPTLKTGSNGINGVNVVRFDGGDQIANTTMTALGTSDFHLFIVLKRNNNNTVFTIGRGGGSNTLTSVFGGNLYVNVQGSGANINDGTVASGTATLIEVRKSSTTTYAKVYGGSETSNTLSPNTLSGYTVGDYWTVPDQPFDGDIAEIILYTSSKSGTDLTNIESYLVTKYAL